MIVDSVRLIVIHQDIVVVVRPRNVAHRAVIVIVGQPGVIVVHHVAVVVLRLVTGAWAGMKHPEATAAIPNVQAIKRTLRAGELCMVASFPRFVWETCAH